MITAQEPGGGGAVTSLLFLVLLIALFYFLIIRPARVRQRQALQVQSQVRPGIEVMTSAGLYATVISVEDDVVVLEVAPGVTNRYARQAIARVVTPEAEAEAKPADAPDEK